MLAWAGFIPKRAATEKMDNPPVEIAPRDSRELSQADRRKAIGFGAALCAIAICLSVSLAF
jgi:hypothetical protein